MKFIIDKLIRFLYRNTSKDLLNSIFSEINSSIENDKYNSFRKDYSIDKSFYFNGSNINFYGKGKIFCDANSYIGALSTIQAYDNCQVKIGKNTQISHNVRIYTHSNIADQDFSLEQTKIKTGNVVIQDFVWIGANVFINPGITIGTNAIVGANAVITKDVPPFAIVGGVPAKIIRYKSSKETNLNSKK